MKTCIYGVGAIGGWIGASLAQAGLRLNAVARGATLDALQRDGLTLVRGTAGGADETRLRVPVHAVADPAALGVQDLVVVAVKAPAMRAVAERIGPLIGPDTLVLSAMNGVPWWFLDGGFGGALTGRRLRAVDPDGAIAAAIPADRVVGGVVHASCSLDAPGVVRHRFGNRLIVGAPSGDASSQDAPQLRARLAELAALLGRAGIETVVSTQIQKDIWFKLWGNMTVNPISALTGATTDRIMDDELVLGFISSVMLEAKAIGTRIGIEIPDSPDDRHVVTRKLGAFKTSMLQDVEAGRAIELDALVTVVRELGRMTDVETPFTDALLGLARLKGRVAGLYGND